MSELLLVLSLAIEIAFAILAIRTAVSWTLHPDRRHGYLALALGSLAVLILLAPAMGGASAGSQVVTDIGVALFLASGYGLLMFRDSFLPYAALTRRALTAALVVVGLLATALQLPANPDSPHSALQTLVLATLVGLWVFCILEPSSPSGWRPGAGPRSRRRGCGRSASATPVY